MKVTSNIYIDIDIFLTSNKNNILQGLIVDGVENQTNMHLINYYQEYVVCLLFDNHKSINDVEVASNIYK